MRMYLSLLALISTIACQRLFLFGSVLLYDNNTAYNVLIDAVGKRMPDNICSNQNWESTSCAKVAVVTSAAPDTQSGDEEYDIGDMPDEAPTKQFFMNLGMSPQHVSIHIDNYQQHTSLDNEAGKRNLQIVKQADVIYFNGGDQSRHSRCWMKDDGSDNALLEVVRRRLNNKQLVLVGVSAGTAINGKLSHGGGDSFGILYFSRSVGLAPKVVSDCKNQESGLVDLRNGTDCLQYEVNGAKFPSFSFLPNIQIDTHFDQRSRLLRLIPSMVDIGISMGVGIDELAVFFYDNGIGRIYGRNGVFVVDGSEAYTLPGKYFKIHNVKVHYLSENDTFDFKSKTLTSAKQLIAIPTYQGYKDSDDLLEQNQATLLITHLIDQTGVYNLGKTQTPTDDDYPTDTPIFQMLFYKESQKTKGYKTQNRYTAEGVRIDLETVGPHLNKLQRQHKFNDRLIVQQI